MPVLLPFLFLFGFANKNHQRKKSAINNNIMYVTESNMSNAFESLPAVLLLVQQGGSQEDRVRQKAEFFAASPALGTRCYFAVMDGDRNPKFIRQVGLKYTRGYYLYRYGKLAHFYTGALTTSGFVDFAMSRTGCPFTTFDDYSVAQDFIESNEYGVVLYLPQAGGELFDRYNQFSSVLRDNFTFGLCPDEDLADELGIDKIPSLVLYRSKDRARVFYPESIETASLVDISSWLSYQKKPRYETFALAEQDMYSKGNPVIVFFTPVEDEAHEATLSLVAELAVKFDNELVFTQIDAVTGSRFMVDIGFSRYADPAVAILTYKGPMKKYRYPEEEPFTVSKITDFITAFLDGRLEPDVKSSQLPEDNTGVVREVNALTLESELDSGMAVAMLYYEPWDSVYRDFEPIYTEIATELQKLRRISFKKINIAANDLVSGPDPSSTPSLYLFKAGEREKPVKFIKNLKKESVLEFLDNEVGVSFDL